MKNSVGKKLVALGKSQYVCLHAPFMRMAGIQKRDEVLLSFDRGRIIITAAKPKRPAKRKKAKA